MATKRTSSKTKSEPVVIEQVVEEVVVTRNPNAMVITRGQLIKWAVLALLLLGLFWYKTNTWPIAAFVNGQPVTRFELNQELYKQGGAQVLDGIITQRLIESELAKENVVVSDEEVNARIDEIKTNLGESFDTALAQQGLTISQLQEQISTQLRLEKLLQDQATVSAEEIDELAGETADRAEAENMLKQQKLQEVIANWVDGIHAGAKIFIVGQK